MDSIRANSHAVFETGFDICYKPELDKKWILSGLESCSIWNQIWYLLQTRAGQEMDYVNSHAVFETRFDICYKQK